MNNLIYTCITFKNLTIYCEHGFKIYKSWVGTSKSTSLSLWPRKKIPLHDILLKYSPTFSLISHNLL